MKILFPYLLDKSLPLSSELKRQHLPYMLVAGAIRLLDKMHEKVLSDLSSERTGKSRRHV